MAKTLNYQTLKKTYFNVTLIDGTKLMIGTPTKKIFDALKSIDKVEDVDNIDDDTLDDIYYACALAMSRNKAGKKITKEYLAEIFDIEDIIIFYNAYVEFIDELNNVKN